MSDFMNMRYRPVRRNNLHMEFSSWEEYPWLDNDERAQHMNLEYDSEVQSLDELGKVFLQFTKHMGYTFVDSIIFNKGFDRETNEPSFYEVDLFDGYAYQGYEQLGISSEPWADPIEDEMEEDEEMERKREYEKMVEDGEL